ncbi:hypothetical protein VB773_11895 [Haloarculaceae archaeon H-GB2-1]|nr:hypothetical protein [Haloarculaceae archaeon H-GB1-1]MEA5386667.1 hypothetical protein [Haloarculaceae archaeon H-GB11]MEA5408189.1 hypothetical protein [Haloarculaceae archaeon H-GB2-1]
MFGLETVSGPVGASMLIGVVLLEALVLYVGYGALEQWVGPTITRALKGE